MKLGFYAEQLFGQIKDTLDMYIGQQYTRLDDITSLNEDDLKGFAAINETLTAFNEYLTNDAELKDSMTEKLDVLQKQMKEMNSKLDTLLERAE